MKWAREISNIEVTIFDAFPVKNISCILQTSKTPQGGDVVDRDPTDEEFIIIYLYDIRYI